MDVPAYAVLPNHVHALVHGPPAAARRLVWQFKQTTGYAWRRTHDHPLWQRGYHDRVLRVDDEPARTVEYILMNPVRLGLAANPHEYPLAGSCSGRPSGRPSIRRDPPG